MTTENSHNSVTTPNRTWAKKIWNFFCSIQLTLYLLLALIVFLFLGSGKMVREAAEFSLLDQMSLFNWLSVLGGKGLSTTYWIWISLICLFFLAINTIVCTIDRLTVIFGIQFQAKLDVNENFLARLSNSTEFTSKKPVEEILHKTKSLFSKHRYRTAEKKTPDGWVLFGHRGRMSLLGPHLAHLGFLFFLLAHLISFFINEKTYGLRFYEGKSEIVAGVENLSLQLEEIVFQNDPGSGRMVDYKSRLSVMEGNQKVREVVIGYNHPLFHKGRVFYQGSYGKELTHLEFSFRRGFSPSSSHASGAVSTSDFSVPVEGEASIPGTDLKLGLGQLIPDFSINSLGQISSRSSRMDNPAIPAFLYQGGELILKSWIFLYNPNFKRLSGKDFNIQFKKGRGITYLELDMVRNPGAPYALFGSILLMAGLCMGFLSSHRRLWLICRNQGEETTLRFGGLASRNKGAFARHIGRLGIAMMDSTAALVSSRQDTGAKIQPDKISTTS